MMGNKSSENEHYLYKQNYTDIPLGRRRWWGRSSVPWGSPPASRGSDTPQGTRPPGPGCSGPMTHCRHLSSFENSGFLKTNKIYRVHVPGFISC